MAKVVKGKGKVKGKKGKWRLSVNTVNMVQVGHS